MTLTPQLQSLIDKVDGFEIVESQIAAILAVEVAQQLVYAAQAGKDPNLWKLRIYQGRSNPWQVFEPLNASNPNKRADTSPIVNIGFDSATFDRARGDIVERQQSDGLFNIDCYGYGVTRSDGGAGHIAGDQDANDAAGRAMRLVRNILMSGYYTTLGLTGIVGERWPQSITFFSPAEDGVAIDRVVGARLVLAVKYNEFSPQYQGQIINEITAAVKRTEDNQVLVTADYQIT